MKNKIKRIFTVKHRKNLSIAIKKSRTKKVLQKISIATKKAMQRPEVQEKIRKLRGGKRSQKNYCSDCGKRIDYRSKQCGTHAQINKKLTKNHIQNLSKAMKQRFKNPLNHPSWRGGLSFELYPREFYKIRNRILERDNYICQKCKEYGNCVHHIDYDKFNNQEDNLICLCNRCNLQVNANRKYWTKIFTMTYVMKNEVYRGRRAKCDNISERIELNLTPEMKNKFQGGNKIC